jgi:hypothetical protein
LAIANPLQMGVMLAGSAVLGFLALGEKASWECIIAIIFITVAVLLLSCGAEESNTAMVAAGQAAEESLTTSTQNGRIAGESPNGLNRLLWPLLGVVGGVAAGPAFAVMTVGVRKMVASALANLPISWLRRSSFAVFQQPTERFVANDFVQGELIDRRRRRQISHDRHVTKPSTALGRRSRR